MEFWGVEVKPGQTLKCEIDDGKLLHLSQASLGESKNKGVETVPIFVKFNDQKLVVGTLSQENCAQIQYDLVFEKEFELSHSSKIASVYFCGYKTSFQDDYPSGEDDLFDSDSEEDVQIAPNTNGKVKVNDQAKPSAGKTTGKEDNSAVKAKTKKEEAVKVDQPKVDDEDDSEDESDDEDMIEQMGDSDDEDEDDSSEDEDDVTPKKAAVSGNKRPAESASKTPVAEKKAKVISPTGQKTGAHMATPHSVKQAGRTPANSDKAKQQSPKSTGSVTCKSCSRRFNSDNALQAHTKAKHSGAK